jgi:hypothetical protein
MPAPVPAPKLDPAAVKEKRDKLIRDTEDSIRVRVSDPWTQRLHDLILIKYAVVGMGIRIADLDRLINKQAEKEAKAS